MICLYIMINVNDVSKLNVNFKNKLLIDLYSLSGYNNY